MATIGRRYERQSSDTMKATRHVPLFEYASFDDFHEHLPLDCRLIGVEMYPQAQFIDDFSHPQRGVYLLGAEDYGLPDTVLARCHEIIRLRGTRSLNLAVAGSIVLYDRTRAKI